MMNIFPIYYAGITLGHFSWVASSDAHFQQKFYPACPFSDRNSTLRALFPDQNHALLENFSAESLAIFFTQYIHALVMFFF